VEREGWLESVIKLREATRSFPWLEGNHLCSGGIKSINGSNGIREIHSEKRKNAGGGGTWITGTPTSPGEGRGRPGEIFRKERAENPPRKLNRQTCEEKLRRQRTRHLA